MWLWDAKTAEVLQRLDASAAMDVVGEEVVLSDIISAAMAPASLLPHMSFSNDVASFHFSCRYNQARTRITRALGSVDCNRVGLTVLAAVLQARAW